MIYEDKTYEGQDVNYMGLKNESQSDKWLEDDNLMLIEAWARDGYTDKDIAERMGVSCGTLSKWKKQFEPIGNALRKGKEIIDYKSTGSYYLSSSFALNSSWGAPNNVPGAVEFRFKAESVPPTYYSQSLWSTDQGLGVFLEYTGSGLTTGSFAGAIVNPYYQYGTLKFISGTDSASVYLPFFNNDWWSVLVNSGSNEYYLYAKNSIYNGEDGNLIGFQASSSINIPTLWSASAKIFFASSSATHTGFSGSLQEIRYYTQPISESSFDALS